MCLPLKGFLLIIPLKATSEDFDFDSMVCSLSLWCVAQYGDWLHNVMQRLTPFVMYSTLWWVDFALFWKFYEKSWVCSSPRYNIVNYQIFLLLVQKPVRSTPLKVHNNIFFWKNMFCNAYIILEENQILNETFSWYFFYFLKRVLFPKKVLPSSHSWK